MDSYTMESIARQQLNRTAGTVRRTSARGSVRRTIRRGIVSGHWQLVWRPEDIA
jgi:hypothetical protein